MSKLSPGTLLLAVAAVLFGLLGAYVVRLQLREEPSVAEEPSALQLVPMASMDLPAGRTISMGDVAITRMTREQIKQAGIRGRYMNQPQQIIGRVLAADLRKGSTFEAEMFYPEGVYPDLAKHLPAGLRAVTLNVEGPAAVAGFARPGTYVDVHFRASSDEQQHVPETTLTLVQGAKVLALNEQTILGGSADADKPRQGQMAVTLAVLPEHAAAIRIVEGHGKFWLALRNPEDGESLASSSPRMLHHVIGRRAEKLYTDAYRGNHFSRTEFIREVTGPTAFAEPFESVKTSPAGWNRFPIGAGRTVLEAIPDRTRTTPAADEN